MSKLIDLTGKVYGRLTVISKSPSPKSHIAWDCLCECGNTTIVLGINLKRNHTKSCGCLQGERCHFKTMSKEYKTWKSMKSRCHQGNGKWNVTYLRKGITICDRWLNSFENFLEDMGYAPSTAHSIDRINTMGNYEPNNCRWATIEQQANNRDNNVLIHYNGHEMTLTQWCRQLKIPYDRTRARLERGHSVEDAFKQNGSDIM